LPAILARDRAQQPIEVAPRAPPRLRPQEARRQARGTSAKAVAHATATPFRFSATIAPSRLTPLTHGQNSTAQLLTAIVIVGIDRNTSCGTFM
jgi:hypothetical protein